MEKEKIIIDLIKKTKLGELEWEQKSKSGIESFFLSLKATPLKSFNIYVVYRPIITYPDFYIVGYFKKDMIFKLQYQQYTKVYELYITIKFRHMLDKKKDSFINTLKSGTINGNYRWKFYENGLNIKNIENKNIFNYLDLNKDIYIHKILEADGDWVKDEVIIAVNKKRIFILLGDIIINVIEYDLYNFLNKILS